MLSTEYIEWKEIFNAIGHPSCIFDTEFNILSINTLASKLLNKSEDEVRGKKCYKLLHGLDEPVEGCPLKKMVASGDFETVEVEIEALNGTFMVSCSPLHDREGNIKEVIHIATDITEYKKLENELKFRSGITEQVNASVITTGLDFKINWVNQSFCTMYGYSSDEVIGRTPDFLNSEPLADDIQGDIYQTVSSGRVWTGEALNRRKDGTTFPCELNIFPLKLKNGKIFAYVGQQYDITERKKAEEELKKSEQKYYSLIENIPDVTWRTDINGNTTFISSNVKDIYGYTPEEICKGGPELWFGRIHSDEINEVKAAFHDLFENNIPLNVEYRIKRKDGKWIWLHDRSTGNYEKDGLKFADGIFSDITRRKKAEIELKEAFEEINRLKEKLEAENVYLREEIVLQHEHGEILGQSDAIKEALKLVEQVAGTDSTVLIMGETGTGKELLAQSIHNLSKRRDRPIVKVNCAAIPSNLIESELFGREKGAYTGALTTQVGRFEIANGSTLFLDEIGELPSELQAKLLRVLQDGTLERLGSTKTIKVDVRIIAATNRDLEQSVKEGIFRSDLYYRLNVFPVSVPPLRERREDILPLTWFFIREFEKKMGKQIESVPGRDIRALQSYSWPGNVREIKNLIERSMIMANGPILHIEIPQVSWSGKSWSRTLDEIEKDHIIAVLERTQWRVRGENGAAKILGLKPTTLDARMKKLDIKR
jgi:PAS domain S-box-containing protein